MSWKSNATPSVRPSRRAPVASGSLRQVRSLEDAAAPMGIACTRPLERVAAALGLLDGAPTEFQVCRDVSFGGVLCALPALTQKTIWTSVFPRWVGFQMPSTRFLLFRCCRIASSRDWLVRNLVVG